MDGDAAQIFTGIYRTNAWGDPETRSGPGSTVSCTSLLRPQIQALLRDWAIRSILDLPCGDFNWMRLVDLSSIYYTGADTVPEPIHRNTLLYARPGRRFIPLDMLRDPLPTADLILCRDGLVHFSFSGIALALQAMKRSRSAYLLVTSFTAHASNENIPMGHWRPLNLDLPPVATA